MSELNHKQEEERKHTGGVADLSPRAEEGQESASESSPCGIDAGIVPELGRWPANTVVTEEGLAKAFGRCPVTLDRWVKSGELPPPVTMGGKKVWTVGAVVRHIENRLEAAMQEHEREKKRFQQLRVGGG